MTSFREAQPNHTRPSDEVSSALLVRALGPGSMASLLKIVLDVAYVALLGAAIALAVAAIALLIASPFNPGVMGARLAVDGRPVDVGFLVARGPQTTALIVAVELYLAALAIVFGRLRRVFETLIIGDPFRPANVGRLRQVGVVLIALEALGYGVRWAVAWLLPERAPRVSVNLTTWFAILVVFVLAEVFREGARLRRDAELTI